MKRITTKRRTLLKRVSQGGIASGIAGIAGCTGGVSDGDGGGDGGGEKELVWASAATKESQCWDCLHPLHVWRTIDFVDEEDTGLSVRHVPGSQICGETSCPSKIRQGVVQAGIASFSNSTGDFPENNIFQIPYLVKAEDSTHLLQPTTMKYTMGTKEVWEEWWIPFAKKYGVLPMSAHYPHLRGLFMGMDWEGEPVRRPEQIQGGKFRRTKSHLSAHALDHWGAIPQDVAWGDTVQGMKSGVIDGLETWISIGLAVGLGEVSSQVVPNYWQNGIDADWVNVEWLKSLNPEQRDVLAEVTKIHTADCTGLVPDVLHRRVGQTKEPPPEGSGLAQTDTATQVLTPDEMELWQEGLDVRENPEQYSDVIDGANDLAGIDVLEEVVLPVADDPIDAEEDIETLPVDEEWSDDDHRGNVGIEIEMWWDDILDDI